MNDDQPSVSSTFFENDLFPYLSDYQKDRVLSCCKLEKFSIGEIILIEGGKNSTLFFLTSGVLKVTKKGTLDLQEVEITKLHAGAILGEMSVLRGSSVSASVKAETYVELITLNVDEIQDEKILQALKLALGGSLVERLERTNQDVQVRNERELKLLEIQNSAARFLVSNFIVLSIYIISLPIADHLAKTLPLDSFVSIFFITTFFIVALIFLRGEKGRFNEYGIKFTKLGQQITSGVLWALPPILIYVFCKWGYLHLTHSSLDLFDLSKNIAPESNRALIITGLILMYFTFSFAQEIVRCVVQKATEIYQRRSSKHAAVIALFVANIVFAATHAHLGLIFPLIAFVAGLYWGTLYIFRGSYLSCAICHGLMGSVIIFLIGVPY